MTDLQFLDKLELVKSTSLTKRTYLIYMGRAFVSYAEFARHAVRKHGLQPHEITDATLGHVRAVSRVAAQLIYQYEQTCVVPHVTEQKISSFTLKMRTFGRQIARQAIENRQISEAYRREAFRVRQGGSINSLALAFAKAGF